MTNHPVRLDHVVLWVADPAVAAGFYERMLGLEPLRIAEFTAGEAPFPSVRVSEETIIDLAPLTLAERMPALHGAADSAGHPVNHVCLSLSADAFDALRARLTEHAVPMTDIGQNSFGARGKAPRNFYFRDPDGNVIEARHYD
ncbi:VOC family protein [Streptomyces hyaluromycini]|uniref:VOC family protein n=1 Tax=Streptomyces hyaluromycini TaxID=1377993 RepID=A0ABV1X511_9ACTN